MIDDALAPGAAKRRIGAARQDDRIFDRDDALVVVAVQRPRLKLSAAEAAFVHQQMKRMLVMIAFLAHGAQRRAEPSNESRVSSCVFASKVRTAIHPPRSPSLRRAPARYSGPGLVQHGIRVVDVYIDFTWALELRQLRQASRGCADWHVSHLLRRLSAGLNADEFVVAPERTIEKQHVRRIRIGCSTGSMCGTAGM